MASIARTGLLRQAQFISSRQFTPSAAALRSSSSILSRTQTARLAPFSSTAHKHILPAGPQVVQGGVNDPAPVPKPSSVHGAYHWTFERLLSLGLVPLTIAPFAGSSMNPTVDALLVTTLLLHSHIGFQAVIIDYIPNYHYPTMRKLFMWGLNLATLLVGIGFYEYETNDVGLCEGIKRVWRAGENDATVGKADIGALGHDGKLKHLTK